MANHDTNMNDLDDTSTTSSFGELVTGVQTMFEQLIACSDTTPEGSYIIEREVMANALHSLTDLFDAIDAIRDEGKTPSPDTSNASLQQVLDRLGAIEKQVQRIQHAHVPKLSRQPTWADIASNPSPPIYYDPPRSCDYRTPSQR
jgi:hypothetical protein